MTASLASPSLPRVTSITLSSLSDIPVILTWLSSMYSIVWSK